MPIFRQNVRSVNIKEIREGATNEESQEGIEEKRREEREELTEGKMREEKEDEQKT